MPAVAEMSADAKLLAIGSEMQGKGCVALYDAPAHALLAKWEHTKAVWCVRLSPDGCCLAAAGYDMKLSLYDTQSCDEVQRIRARMQLSSYQVNFLSLFGNFNLSL